MPTLLEQQKKAAERRLKAAEDAKAKAQRERQAGMRERKIKAAIYKQKAWMLGTTLLDTDLTPQEHAVIAGILARRKEPPADWNLLTDWMPSRAPVRSKFEKPDPVRDAAE